MFPQVSDPPDHCGRGTVTAMQRRRDGWRSTVRFVGFPVVNAATMVAGFHEHPTHIQLTAYTVGVVASFAVALAMDDKPPQKKRAFACSTAFAATTR
ncbi:hypothetical protein [Actinomycetospora chibensis]|uniref:Uncharacterized protein n=1 Tax=Actinomycetospora chibensis TaxID=663606 RepID=A0ABV9REI9_9PSEU|nr:hypothetical protein [Actinomycetospora chibensis]MDD7925004.1 hypothetical protein [Actinomycetospora chibensis]